MPTVRNASSPHPRRPSDAHTTRTGNGPRPSPLRSGVALLLIGATLSCGESASGPRSYSLGGTVAGLTGTVVLRNNGGDDLTRSSNGAFTFATPVQGGLPYSVTVATQPAGQSCSVGSGSGTMGSANVTGVQVACADLTWTIGGTVAGLTGTVVLRNNGGDDLPVSANGAFTFVTPLHTDSTYDVTVLAQPAGQSCVVGTGTGTVAGANVTSVLVTCADLTYTIGGTVSGLTGTAVLRNNGGDDLSVSADGAFTFATPLHTDSTYDVSVFMQPTDQTCSVTGGTGTVTGANVTGVGIACAANLYTIGGTASGLKGLGCVLRNNGEDLPVTGDGGFTFPTPQPTGSPYAATVVSQPVGPNQSCALASSSGTVNGADVTDMGLTCTVIRPACASGTFLLGAMAGDQGAGQLSASGTGEAWYRVRLTEEALTSTYLSARISLSVPPGVDWDLYVYCSSCAGREAGRSTGITGANETVTVRWDDRFAITDDDDIYIHVEYFSGQSATPWVLTVAGHVITNTVTCTP